MGHVEHARAATSDGELNDIDHVMVAVYVTVRGTAAGGS
jgi:hypothetical protein